METHHTPACPQITSEEKLDALDWVMRGCPVYEEPPEGIVLQSLMSDGQISLHMSSTGRRLYVITPRGSAVYGKHLRAVAKPCPYAVGLGIALAASWGGFGVLIWWVTS